MSSHRFEQTSGVEMDGWTVSPEMVWGGVGKHFSVKGQVGSAHLNYSALLPEHESSHREHVDDEMIWPAWGVVCSPLVWGSTAPGCFVDRARHNHVLPSAVR